jgi:hypothetical protein
VRCGTRYAAADMSHANMLPTVGRAFVQQRMCSAYCGWRAKTLVCIATAAAWCMPRQMKGCVLRACLDAGQVSHIPDILPSA